MKDSYINIKEIEDKVNKMIEKDIPIQYYDEKQKNSDNVEDADLEINEGVEALKVEMEGGQQYEK